MVKKNRLGKGLSALLSEDVEDLDVRQEPSGKNLISINKISLSKFQARKKFNQEKLKELSESIEKNGLLQPIIIRKGKKNFELVAGERRLKACRLIGHKEISAIISNFDDKKAFESGLIENLQREDLTCIEEAEGYNRLMNEFNYTQEELASIVSKSRSHVANCIRLLNLPNEIISYVENEVITAGHAKILVNLPNAQFIAKKIIDKKLSVRQSENLVRAFKKNSNLRIIPNKNPDILNLERSLENKTGLNVKIKNKKNNSGAVYFEYKNLEQLDRIIDTIKKNY